MLMGGNYELQKRWLTHLWPSSPTLGLTDSTHTSASQSRCGSCHDLTLMNQWEALETTLTCHLENVVVVKHSRVLYDTNLHSAAATFGVSVAVDGHLELVYQIFVTDEIDWNQRDYEVSLVQSHHDRCWVSWIAAHLHLASCKNEMWLQVSPLSNP